MKTTPGPWTIEGKRDPITIMGTGPDARVAMVGYMGDAKLIAAAPDLADLLGAILACDVSTIDGNLVTDARKALKKAGR